MISTQLEEALEQPLVETQRRAAEVILDMASDHAKFLLTDVARDTRLRGVHWAKIEKAAKTLAKKGAIKLQMHPRGEGYMVIAEGSELLIDTEADALLEVSEGGFRLNACKTPLEKAREFAQKTFQKAGKGLDETIPDFDKNYKDLQKRCKKALNVPRVQMPVIEPTDMDDFHKALTTGQIDIFKPWAKGTFIAPKHLKGSDPQSKEWIQLGFKDGKVSDDKIRAKWTKVTANRLLPTQSQIWLEKLIGLIAKYGPPVAGSPISKATLIVSKEGYILDGHHRFGQAILANPKLKMNALVVPLPINKLLKIGRSYGNAIGNQQKA
jgi:hypothetical protein